MGIVIGYNDLWLRAYNEDKLPPSRQYQQPAQVVNFEAARIGMYQRGWNDAMCKRPAQLHNAEYLSGYRMAAIART